MHIGCENLVRVCFAVYHLFRCRCCLFCLRLYVCLVRVFLSLVFLVLFLVKCIQLNLDEDDTEWLTDWSVGLVSFRLSQFKLTSLSQLFARKIHFSCIFLTLSNFASCFFSLFFLSLSIIEPSSGSSSLVTAWNICRTQIRNVQIYKCDICVTFLVFTFIFELNTHTHTHS